MSFGQAVSTCLRKYAEFTGRARRSEYWWFILFAALVQAVVTSLVGASLSDGVGDAVSLVFLLPTLAVGSRRLHDTDHSAWSLLLIFLPIIGWTILIVWLATAGTVADNRFGPPPA